MGSAAQVVLSLLLSVAVQRELSLPASVALPKELNMTIEYSHPDSAVGRAPRPLVPAANAPDRSLFFRIEHRMAQLIALLMVLSSIALGLLMAGQVLMRYGLQSPFLGIEELAPMLALWAYFMGMVYATREQEHISGGVVALLVKKATTICTIRLLGTLACLIATCVFAWYAWDFSSFNLKLHRKSLYMRWPKSLWDFSMVIGFTLMAFYYCLQVIAQWRDLMLARKNNK